MKKLLLVLMFVAVVIALGVMPIVAAAQTGAPPVQLPGILNNPILLMVIGGAIKFLPKVRAAIANKFIPYILAAVAWLGTIIGPDVAHAAGGPLAVVIPVVALFGIKLGFLGSLGSAIGSTAWSWALNEMFVRHLTKKPADSV